VIAHRGAVSVESKLGHGTTIAIYLPLDEDAIAGVGTRVEDSSASPIRGSGRVLIVDDEEFIRRVLRRMLTSLGYDAVTTCDGPEFLAAFRRDHERIDLVIIDLTMPIMNGREVLAELRQINLDTPALITSGFDLEAEAFDLDMNDAHRGFLQKPFTTLELSRTVAAALERGDTGRSAKDTLSRFRST